MKKENVLCLDELITLLGHGIGLELASKVFYDFDNRFYMKYKDLPRHTYRKKEAEAFRNYIVAYYKVQIKNVEDEKNEGEIV
jgi:hypothetical protein